MNLLIAAEDTAFREALLQRFRRQGHHILDASEVAEALRRAAQERIDVALVGLARSPGLELLKHLKASDPYCQVIVLADEASADSAVGVTAQGAYDSLPRSTPLRELEVLAARAFEHGHLQRENARLKEALQRGVPRPEIVGRSPAVQEVLRLIGKAGPTRSPVLILGEGGTGKSLVARVLHQASPRAGKPLAAVDCAATNQAVLEGELFGQEREAMAGAATARMGLFEIADGGTLFLNELGELAGGLQTKLLRVLEEGTIRPVGSTREQRVDVRVIAATTKDLAAEVEAGRFRSDLYLRAGVLTIRLPPLRQRPEDIPLLADHFLDRSPGRGWTVTDEAIRALMTYSWPGNVRELASVIQRATILAEGGVIRPLDLPEAVAAGRAVVAAPHQHASPAGEPGTLADREREQVLAALRRCGWNKARAARALGVSRRSLYRLIEKHQIGTPEAS